MNIRASLLTISVLVAIAAGCDAARDFVVVEPVRYEAPSPAAVTNADSRWVRTTADKAERFRVRIGALTYQRITDPYKRGPLSLEQQMSAFWAFAEAEVVRERMCAAARTPADARHMSVSNGNPVVFWVYVQCV
jgi:hypothetical protein